MTATVTVVAMLKMDENVNLRLERHVNCFFLLFYDSPLGTGLYISQNIE